MNLLGVASKNVMRNKFRTVLTIAGGAVAVLAFVLLRTVVDAWYVGVDNAARDRLATRHKVSITMTMPKRYIDIVRQTPGVKAATYMNWFGAKDPKDENNFFANMAVDAASTLEVYPEMVLSAEDRERWLGDRQGAILGDVLARKLKVSVGDKVTLRGTIYPGDWTFNVSGIYRASQKSLDRSQFFFHWDYLNDSVPERRKDQIGWMASRIDDPQKSADISAAIDKVFDEKDQQTATMSEKAMNNSFMATFSAVLTALDIVSVIILVIMMMILGNTIAMGVRERTTEYGVLRAIGFSPGHVRIFVLGEALTTGVLTGLIGLAISYPIVQLGMGAWLEENMGAWFPYFRISPTTAVAGIGLAVGLALIASLIPAYNAGKLSVTDALRRVA
jgi:putative ABC transport system permease protein